MAGGLLDLRATIAPKLISCAYREVATNDAHPRSRRRGNSRRSNRRPFSRPQRSCRAVPTARSLNTDVGKRDSLRPDEVEDVMSGARAVGRHGYLDATLILIAYRHGLRVSELVALRWEQVDFKARRYT